MRIEGIDIEAVYGCVPRNATDNLQELGRLVGAAKAKTIVNATGFSTRRIAAPGTDVIDIVLPAARRALEGIDPGAIGGVVSVSFSDRNRFPALSARLQAALGLPQNIAAYDISMACSGWIYGLFAAAQLVKATGKRVLLADGDVQSAWLDGSDPGTVAVMGDAGTATLLAPGSAAWEFSFLTDGSGADALSCADKIRMDGFAVFRFVAGPVKKMLENAMRESGILAGLKPSLFVPHQANMYMVRQLASSLGLEDRTLSGGEKYANTGSSSAPLAIADGGGTAGTALFAGFGAGFSAGAVVVSSFGNPRRGVSEL